MVSCWVSESTSWREKWGEKFVILSSPVTPTPSPRFTDQDEQVTQHCFQYTSTVLTSTLAFQKEQKLKCECQVRERSALRLSQERSCPALSPGKSSTREKPISI